MPSSPFHPAKTSTFTIWPSVPSSQRPNPSTDAGSSPNPHFRPGHEQTCPSPPQNSYGDRTESQCVHGEILKKGISARLSNPVSAANLPSAVTLTSLDQTKANKYTQWRLSTVASSTTMAWRRKPLTRPPWMTCASWLYSRLQDQRNDFLSRSSLNVNTPSLTTCTCIFLST